MIGTSWITLPSSFLRPKVFIKGPNLVAVCSSSRSRALFTDWRLMPPMPFERNPASLSFRKVSAKPLWDTNELLPKFAKLKEEEELSLLGVPMSIACRSETN